MLTYYCPFPQNSSSRATCAGAGGGPGIPSHFANRSNAGRQGVDVNGRGACHERASIRERAVFGSTARIDRFHPDTSKDRRSEPLSEESEPRVAFGGGRRSIPFDRHGAVLVLRNLRHRVERVASQDVDQRLRVVKRRERGFDPFRTRYVVDGHARPSTAEPVVSFPRRGNRTRDLIRGSP